jgi:hypothetical protein
MGCKNRIKYAERIEFYRIDSVEYLPIGFPSVANLDPRWVAHTNKGKFTYYQQVEVGDSVQIIIRNVDTTLFEPVINHSEIK